MKVDARVSLRKNVLYAEFFWSVFSRIRIEYRNLQNKSPCWVQMRENADQKNSEYGLLLRSLYILAKHVKTK